MSSKNHQVASFPIISNWINGPNQNMFLRLREYEEQLVRAIPIDFRLKS